MVVSQKKPILVFSFHDYYTAKRFYYAEKEEHCNTHNAKLVAYQNTNSNRGPHYMIGNANGLACYWNFKSIQESYDGERVYYFSLEICNPSRMEKLIIVSRIKSKNRVGGYIHKFLFGYDLLKNEYKVMCIMKHEGDYDYYIFTLGSTKPWRKIKNPWLKQRPLEFQTLSPRNLPSLLPISCNGHLFYEMENDITQKENYKRMALIAFNLHGDKFQNINFPGDEEFVSSYNTNEFSPLEYKGCFCYASMDKIDPYNCKVVLHILNDVVKHIWVKETIMFSLPREFDNSLSPASTGILTFCNQVILYKRLGSEQQKGDVIPFYNLHSRKLEEVKVPKECYGNNHISSHVENFLSLKTLVTVTGEVNTREVLKRYKQNGYLKQEFFDDILTSNPEVISFLDPC